MAPVSTVVRLGLALAVLVGVGVVMLPTPEGMTPQAKHLMGVFIIALVLWITEAIPIAATAFLIIVLQPLYGIVTLPAAAAGFMSPVFLFVTAMFCIAQVVTDTGLAKRFALWLLGRAGNDSRRVVLAFMIGAAFMSMAVSDVPVSAVWMAMAIPLLAGAGVVPGQSSLGKALMMGVPIAALIGGVGTPAGSSINILGLFQIQQFGNVTVTFLQWMAIGIPMVLILTPIAWWVLMRFYPPEIPTLGDMTAIAAERRQLGALTAREKKVLGLIGTMLVLWTASSWFPAIDVTMVALGGAVAMFVPGIRLLTWPRAQQTIGWDALMLVGGVTSLGAAAGSTGLAKYLVGTLPDMQLWPIWAAIALISVVTVLIHLPVPINPAIVAVLIPPIALLAMSTGANPALYTLPVVFTASCAFLLPLDAVVIITYAKGYYRMGDMFLPGAVISAIWVVVMTILMVLIAPVVGLF
jgi:solute carrier family 13 (sodium-dependent dicarboxylate transporter), member 2/3/5